MTYASLGGDSSVVLNCVVCVVQFWKVHLLICFDSSNPMGHDCQAVVLGFFPFAIGFCGAGLTDSCRKTGSYMSTMQQQYLPCF